MKFLISGILAWTMVAAAVAQQEGIQFRSNAPWAEVLAQAKAENKLIFLDAYAVWCGPCKMMDRDVFAQAEVGAFFNERFVNAKMDMEKGEGVNLATQYGVQAYPTFLFLDGNGKVMHRVVGYYQPEAFLEIGQLALDPDRRLAGVEARYEAGDRSPELLSTLMQAFEQAMDPRASELIDDYLATQSDWSTPDNMRLIGNNLKKTDSETFRYLITHRTDFEEEFGAYPVLNAIQSLVLNEAFALSTETPTIEDIRRAFVRKLPADLAEQLFLLTQMNFYRAQQDMDNYAASAVAYYQKYPSQDAEELNEQAWAFYLSIDNLEHLKAALAWAQQSVALDSQYYNNDTLAALYYKLGDKKNARKAAEKAIQLAKDSGQDASETELLLEKIRKK